MEADERALLIRIHRNAILDTLAKAGPGRLQGKMLYRLMVSWFPIYDRTCFARDLLYLENKGYVERRDRLGRINARAEWGDAAWSLTAAGDEIANHLQQDPALEV